MKIATFFVPKLGSRLGLVEGESVKDLTSIDPKLFSSLETLVHEASLNGKSIDETVSSTIADKATKSYNLAELDIAPSQLKAHLIKPLNPSEVWGCGVTYKTSLSGRIEESKIPTFYEMVYSAERPEIFFKATGNRCVGPNEPICIRSDSNWTVPEHELTFITGENKDIVGYTVGNDVSARDIEGENPLYLPQCKIYRGCCSIGPLIATTKEIPNPMSLEMQATVYRNREIVFEGRTNTSRIKRTFQELLEYLIRDNPVPPCTPVLTGTGIVPPMGFALKEGDIVELKIEKIGVLRNPVTKL